jgi:hypothetical protein
VRASPRFHPDESYLKNLAEYTHFCPRTDDDACYT